MGALVIWLFGRMMVRLSGVTIWVWKIRTLSMTPSRPATSTLSPARNGRSRISITPEAMLDRESFSARPMPRPAAPTTASSEVVGTPATSRATMNTTTSAIA